MRASNLRVGYFTAMSLMKLVFMVESSPGAFLYLREICLYDHVDIIYRGRGLTDPPYRFNPPIGGQAAKRGHQVFMPNS